MKRRSVRGLVIAGAGLVALASGSADQEKGGAGMELIELTNGTVVVGVVPPLGGRVVLLKTAGGENVLDSDPKLLEAAVPATRSRNAPFARGTAASCGSALRRASGRSRT